MALWVIRILFLSMCTVGGYAISQVRPEFVGSSYSGLVGMATLLTGLQAGGAKVILATFSNPYIAAELPPTSAYLIAWSFSPVSQRAAARGLLGLATISGQLPITIPSVAPYGAGLRRESLIAPTTPARP